ncbi:MAG: hypothetical protein ACKFIZ_00500 [Candidatus Hodgkinia cicadicola]
MFSLGYTCLSASIMMFSKRTGLIKLSVIAASAKPVPPISVVLGQKKVNIQDFCKRFNETTADLKEKLPLCTKLYLYGDENYNLVVCGPTVTQLVKYAANMVKGASLPGKQAIATLACNDVLSIASLKLKDTLSCEVKSVLRSVLGSLTSMGVSVE